MEITRTVHCPDRASWRAWLQEHYRGESDVWLIYHKLASGKPRIPYADAVEEALCFGWIDSTMKTLDADRQAQRFSPRRPRSGFSQINRERLRRLVDAGRVAPDVLPSVLPVLDEPFVAADDILAALRSDPAGWEAFQRWPDSYRRIRIAYVEGARSRPEEFEKRLRHLLRMNAAGKQFGFGIESFYGPGRGEAPR